MYASLWLILVFVHKIKSFECPSENGTFANPDDYRSYYVCSNYCSKQQYCVAPNVYFTRTSEKCVTGKPDWAPRFDLSGQFRSANKMDTYIRQEEYIVYISHEGSTTSQTTIARYINETDAIGLQVTNSLISGCVAVSNVHIAATNNRKFCFAKTLHRYSSNCNLPASYFDRYCKTY